MLRLASLTTLVPCVTSKEDALAPFFSKKQSSSPIAESLSDQGPNPERNLIRTLIETSVSDIKLEYTKEDEP